MKRAPVGYLYFSENWWSFCSEEVGAGCIEERVLGEGLRGCWGGKGGRFNTNKTMNQTDLCDILWLYVFLMLFQQLWL